MNKIKSILLHGVITLAISSCNGGGGGGGSNQTPPQPTPTTAPTPTPTVSHAPSDNVVPYPPAHPSGKYDACIPLKSSYPCTGNGCVGPVPSLWVVDGKNPGANSNAMMHPGEIYTKEKFGYGRWTAILKASNSLGADTSFFLFNYVGAEKTWPANWHEIDFEFNPGLRPKPSNAMSGMLYADGSRRLDRQLYLPPSASIPVILPDDGSQLYNNFVSINTFAYDANGKTAASNHQYNYQLANGGSPFTEFHTYTMDYTPNGIWWEIDGKVVTYSNDDFLKAGGDTPNPTCEQFIHTTDMNAFRVNPKLNMYLNIWNAATTSAEYFAGKVQPIVGSNSIYQSVKFYPLINAKCGSEGPAACTDNASYQADPEFNSDFKNNTYQVGGVTKSFADIWTKDESYYQSLGGVFSADAVSVVPGTGLTLSLIPVKDTKTYTFRSTIEGITNVSYVTKSSCLAGDPYINLGQINSPTSIISYVLPKDVLEVSFTKFEVPSTYYGACRLYPQDFESPHLPIVAQWQASPPHSITGSDDCITGAPSPYTNWNPSVCITSNELPNN